MAHPDLDSLLDALLPFAQQQLEKRGEFFPFGASMGVDGKIAYVAAQLHDEQPPSQEVIDVLVSGLQRSAESGELRAAGVCLDVRTIPPGSSEKTDAICVRVERQGEAVAIYLPYRKPRLGKTKYGELFATAGESVIYIGGCGVTVSCNRPPSAAAETAIRCADVVRANETRALEATI